MHPLFVGLYSAVVILGCLTDGTLAIRRGMSNTGDDNETFEFFTLSQEWPYSFCTTNKCQNTNKLQPLFNIHGLWPEKVSGTCQGQFNYSELQPIMNELMLGWMDLENPIGNPEKFWLHEYDKHGKCASSDSRYASTFLYFNAGLKLHNNYTLTAMLAQGGIVPGATPVKASSIRDAVQSSFGYVPELSCVSQGGTIYLYELRLCFEKDLTPRNCVSSGGQNRRRPRTGGDLLYEPEQSGKPDYSTDYGSSLSGPRLPSAEPCNLDSEVLLPAKLDGRA